MKNGRLMKNFPFVHISRVFSIQSMHCTIQQLFRDLSLSCTMRLCAYEGGGKKINGEVKIILQRKILFPTSRYARCILYTQFMSLIYETVNRFILSDFYFPDNAEGPADEKSFVWKNMWVRWENTMYNPSIKKTKLIIKTIHVYGKMNTTNSPQFSPSLLLFTPELGPWSKKKNNYNVIFFKTWMDTVQKHKRIFVTFIFRENGILDCYFDTPLRTS